VIASLTEPEFDVQRACLMLGASVTGYYDWKGRSPSEGAFPVRSDAEACLAC
jgi:hypothetical protein